MRNYSKESEWEKKIYERMQCKINKDLGLRFKIYLKSKNINFSTWLENKIKEDGIMKTVGYLWNDKDIEIVEVDGEMYTLYGWNGEHYSKCWKVLDNKGLDRVEEDREYTLTPIYVQNGNDFEIINYNVTIN